MRHLAPLLICLALALPAAAQQAEVAFGGIKADTTQPVEVTADSLSVSQDDGAAIFSGNVRVAQGDMVLTAGEVRVEYDAASKAISRLLATGGVVLAAGADAAKAESAVYTIATGEVVLTGSVVLTQGNAALSGNELTVNLTTGTGRMAGRVTTTFVPGGN